MYNALREVPQLKKLVQVGLRDYCQGSSTSSVTAMAASPHTWTRI